MADDDVWLQMHAGCTDFALLSWDLKKLNFDAKGFFFFKHTATLRILPTQQRYSHHISDFITIDSRLWTFNKIMYPFWGGEIRMLCYLWGWSSACISSWIFLIIL